MELVTQVIGNGNGSLHQVSGNGRVPTHHLEKSEPEGLSFQERPNLSRRARLNADWPITIRSFKAVPLASPPKTLWDTAWEMRRVWNDLVEIFNRASKEDIHEWHFTFTPDDGAGETATKKKKKPVFFIESDGSLSSSASLEPFVGGYAEAYAEFRQRKEVFKRQDGKCALERGNAKLSKEDRAAIWLPFEYRKTSRPLTVDELRMEHVKAAAALQIAETAKQSKTNEEGRESLKKKIATLAAKLESLQDGERLAALEKAIARYDRAAEIYGGTVPSLHLVGKTRAGIIPSACYEAVIARFIVTVKEWKKAPKTKGVPKMKFGPMMEFNIPCVFNEGITVAQLEGGGQRARLTDTRELKPLDGKTPATSSEYLHNGDFFIMYSGESTVIPFHVAYNWLGTKANPQPPLPPNARVKRVSLVGRRTEALPWNYELQVQIEHPPETPLPPTGRYAGIDMGWRMLDGRLRVAYLVDNAGYEYELSIPMDGGNQATRKFNRYAEKVGYMEPRINDWRELDTAQRQIDMEQVEVKARIKETALSLPTLPEPVIRFLRAYHQAGRQSMLQLWRALQESGEAPAVFLILDEWQRMSALKAKRLGATNEQLLTVRDNAYRLYSVWVAKNFDVVAWEGDLNLKNMAEDKRVQLDRTLRNAAGWRFVAGLSSLRQVIPQALKKRGRILQGEKAAGTSSKCSVCGTRMTGEPDKLIRTCQKGHELDRDANAGRNLLNRIEGATSITAPPVEIPQDLRRYLRLM